MKELMDIIKRVASARIFVLAAILATTIIQPALSAQTYSEIPKNFFSFKKYKLSYKYFNKFAQLDISGAGLQTRTLHEFAKHYVDGFNDLMEEDQASAMTEFRAAAMILPEYFHVDFIIALIFEENGDFRNAARYYKSYLDKLKKFHDGSYRITQPLIEKTVWFGIIDYEDAKAIIDERMARHGIDMRTVSPPRRFSPIIIVFSAIVIAAAIYLMTMSGPLRKLINRYRASRFSSEGLWMCPDCGRVNNNVSVVCYGCNKKREVA